MAAALVLWAIVPMFVPAVSVRAAERVLFPKPLHITRELSDPVTQKTTRIEEYCLGNRIVSTSGERTAIADYGKGELTEIDFAAGTYSITKFEQLARIDALRPAAANDAPADRESRRVTRMSSEQQVTLSRGAIEAVLGIGYPYRNDASADAVLGALRVHEPHRISANATGSVQDEAYRLPLEQVLRVDAGGEIVETRNVVVRLGDEMPSADVMTIPPGAKWVESKRVATQRLLDELDRPPVRSKSDD
jgi:hypothetical protein